MSAAPAGKKPSKPSAPSTAAVRVTAADGEVVFALSLALAGRNPRHGAIMSLGMAAMTVDTRRVVGHFSANIALSNSEVAPDVRDFWRSRPPSELAALTADPIAREVAMAALVEWARGICKKGATLVGSPIMAAYGFLSRYLLDFSGGSATVPWGYSGVCVRSFCAGVLGVTCTEVTNDPVYKSWCAALGTASTPQTQELLATAPSVQAMQALVAADVYVQAVHHRRQLGAAVVSGAESPPLLLFERANSATRVMSHFVPTPPAPLDDTFIPDGCFQEYPSILDADFASRNASAIAAHLATGSAEGTFVATEKVHGANLAIWIRCGAGEPRMRCARRTGLLSVKDSTAFFRFDTLVATFASDLVAHVCPRAIAVLPSHQNPSATDSVPTAPAREFDVVVFGEIAGGEYTADNAPADLGSTRVQRGVQYAPHNFFLPFDLAIRAVDAAAPSPELTFIDYDVSSEIFRTMPSVQRWRSARAAGGVAALPTVVVPPAIATGSLAEVMVATASFPSRIPGFLGLPPLRSGEASASCGATATAAADGGDAAFHNDGNFAEGLVIRPCREPRRSSGDRGMLKRKHPMFREAAGGSLEGMGVDALMAALTNENRVGSVMSKQLGGDRAPPRRSSAIAGVPSIETLVVRDAAKDARVLLAVRDAEGAADLARLDAALTADVDTASATVNEDMERWLKLAAAAADRSFAEPS